MNNKSAVHNRTWTFEETGMLCWVLLLIAMVISSIVPFSDRLLDPTAYWDKIFHFVTSCAAAILPLVFVSSRRLAICLAALVPVLGFGLEYMQRGISGRTFSPEDLIANNLGVIAGLIIGCGFRIYRRIKRSGLKK